MHVFVTGATGWIGSAANTSIIRIALALISLAGIAAPLLADTTDSIRVIGHSVEGRSIKVYTLEAADGEENGRTLVIVGGIHGGYEWNSVQLTQLLLEHYLGNRGSIPSDVTVHIIPVLNPDGLYRIAGQADPELLDYSRLRLSRDRLIPGRVNANGVDLNRNFDEEWAPVSYHGQRRVLTGSGPFSEPETRAIRDFVHQAEPEAVVFFHSASNEIWYGGLPDAWEPAHRLARAYSRASGYVIDEDEWDDTPTEFPVSGSASGYFYLQGIPTLTIELATRWDPEFERNLRGVNALMDALSSGRE